VAIEDYKLWGWCALENFGSFTFLVRLLVAVAKMGKCKNVRLGAWGWECLMFVLSFIFVVNGFLVTVEASRSWGLSTKLYRSS
jgi:hypothetical protein